jgi:CheY-like chemotaxis protein
MKDSTSQSLAGMGRILLVDDNKLGLSARKHILEAEGFRVSTAAEGEEALQHLENGEFDLIITDYKMPKLDGSQLIKAVRARQSAIPIILISGYTEPLGLNEENTGADVVLTKCAGEVPQLLRAVNRVLRRQTRKPPHTQGGTPKTRQQRGG